MSKTICNHCGQLIQHVPDTLLEHEEYKQIHGVDGNYSITKTGKVYSHKRHQYVKESNRRVGLLCYGVLKQFKVDELVLRAFYEGYETGRKVHHIDGNKDNHSLNNLKVI